MNQWNLSRSATLAAIQTAALWIGVDPFVNGVCLILIGASMAYLWR